jgi:competence protein ComEC
MKTMRASMNIHIGGMIAVLKNFHPKELWVGLLPPSSALDNVIATARALGVKVVRRWENDEFEFGATQITVLFPHASGQSAQNRRTMIRSCWK